MDELDEFNEAPHIVRERERARDEFSRSSFEVASVNGVTSIESSRSGGDISTDLLGQDDLDTELITDLNKNSHIIA